jgi:hypothetical protein
MTMPHTAGQQTRATELISDIHVKDLKVPDRDHADQLDLIHDMRLKMFDQRTSQEVATNGVKPYLPMLSSDEKEVIMEQYFKSKKKLSKA